jgi:hypothetical protein
MRRTRADLYHWDVTMKRPAAAGWWDSAAAPPDLCVTLTPLSPALTTCDPMVVPISATLVGPITAATSTTSSTVKVGAQGDQAMHADAARATYAVSGAGVTVGILSDSFNLKGGMAADQAAGNLPAAVTILQEGPAGSSDEGRAMAELVHQVAPGAAIDFTSAFQSEAGFAAGIRALAAAGCKVIVDDVTYLDEPFFQQGGAIQSAIAAVVAQGVSYFTSASNQGSAFYQHAFAGLSARLPGLNGTYLAMNFGTPTAPQALQSLTIAKGSTATLDLQWDRPFASAGGAGTTDSLGMVLYDATGNIVASALVNRTGGDPVQILRFTNTTAGTAFRLAIITNGGPAPPNLIKYIAYGQGTTIDDPNAGAGSGTVIGHEDEAGVNSVGAIAAANTPALGGSGVIESFSSVGPGTLLFDTSGNRLTDAAGGRMVSFVAPDGIATSVFNPFYGTSAAAPNAAAVAALMLQANPALTPAQLSHDLAKSAVSVQGPAGGVGAGLIQATTAVKLAAASRPIITPPAPTIAATTPTGPQTSAWATGPATTPLAAALNALPTDPAAAGFSVNLAPGIALPDLQATTSTAFACVAGGLNLVVLVPLADIGAHG